MKWIKYHSLFDVDFDILRQLKNGQPVKLPENEQMFIPQYAHPERNQYIGEFEDGKHFVIVEVQGAKIVVWMSEKHVQNPILHHETAVYAGQPNSVA